MEVMRNLKRFELLCSGISFVHTFFGILSKSPPTLRELYLSIPKKRLTPQSFRLPTEMQFTSGITKLNLYTENAEKDLQNIAHLLKWPQRLEELTLFDASLESFQHLLEIHASTIRHLAIGPLQRFNIEVTKFPELTFLSLHFCADPKFPSTETLQRVFTISKLRTFECDCFQLKRNKLKRIEMIIQKALRRNRPLQLVEFKTIEEAPSLATSFGEDMAKRMAQKGVQFEVLIG
jgi:hypothetical protein